MGSVEPHFVKLFKLSQLTVEYLLYSQDYLSGMLTAVEEKLRKTLEVSHLMGLCKRDGATV